MKVKKMLLYSIVMLLTLGYATTSCKDDKDDGGNKGYNPSKPVVFTNFDPKEGSARTRFFIYGSNFGTDVSKIRVFVGDLKLPVISSDGSQIYCVIPLRAYGEEVKVQILDNDNNVAAEHKFDESFKYLKRLAVSTLVGKVDKDNNSSIVNGSFADAQFEDTWVLQYDKAPNGEKHVYVFERGRALRRINLTKETVETIFTNGQGMFRNMQSMAFDNTRDTMFFADDHGSRDKNLAVISYALRANGFKNVYPYIFDRTGYACAVNPLNGDLYYNTYWNGEIMKAHGQYNTATQQWEGRAMFKLSSTSDSHSYMFMHPDGLYAYFLGWHCIMKSQMIKNAVTGSYELENPTVFAGFFDRSGYEDKMGTEARFNTLRQGVFVKNPEYVKAGKTDVYDFYVCDEQNQCVRLVTPDTEVSTFAGRGSPTFNGDKWGYIDGDLRKEARFRDLTGITYDEETETFYIGDRNNKRIRTISVQ